jgi:hypothetical protein
VVEATGLGSGERADDVAATADADHQRPAGAREHRIGVGWGRGHGPERTLARR